MTSKCSNKTNLSLWRKDSEVMDNCKMCGERQTLVHVFNCYPIGVTMSSMMLYCQSNFDTTTDTGPEQNYIILCCHQTALAILTRGQCMWINYKKQAVIFICLEEAYIAAKKRKQKSILGPFCRDKNNGYNMELITLEVGSLGTTQSLPWWLQAAPWYPLYHGVR